MSGAPQGDIVPATATQAKIGALREKFAGFQSQWEMETKHRINRDGTKLDGVKESMVKLEQTLNSEIKRRVEANKALQAMFESQISSIQDRLEAIFVDRLDKLQLSVDSLSDRMSAVERDFTVTREQYINDIEEKNAAVARDTNGLQNAFENEKVDRRERELGLFKRLGDHEARTRTALEAQSGSREQRYQHLRGELEEMRRARERGDDKFQTFILEEVAAVKNGLVAESHAREQADDDIVQALNHYTKCLQDALRIINQH
uniref:SF-assemblin n=1 Tax=Alexandrium monilatum TaxID=311494 RepID=A0A7S4SGD5_9DINO